MSRLFSNSAGDSIADLTASPIGSTANFVTFSAWFKTTSKDINQMIVQIADQSADVRLGLWYGGLAYANDNMECFTINTGASVGVSLSPTVSTNVWHHGAGVIAGTGLRTAFLDGVAGTPDRTFPVSLTGLDSISIGRALHVSPGDSFDGYIAHVAVWTVALTEAEIEQLANGANPLDIRGSDLVFYAPLDTSTIADIVGGATLVNSGTSFDSDNPTVYAQTGTIPYFAAATYSDGTFDDIIDLTGIFAGTGPDSYYGIFSAWLKPEPGANFGNGGLIYFEQGGFGGAEFSIGFDNSGKPFVAILEVGLDLVPIPLWLANSGMTFNAWNHLLLSWDLTIPEVYCVINDSVVGGTYPEEMTNPRGPGTADWADPGLGSSTGISWLFGVVHPLFVDEYQGCFAELYLNTQQFLLVTTTTNRRKFIDVHGRPVDLGANGSLPTGTAPMMFLRGDFTNYYQNYGSGPWWPTSTTGTPCVDTQLTAVSPPVPLVGGVACDGGPHITEVPFDLVITLTNLNTLDVANVTIDVTLSNDIYVAEDGVTANDFGGTVTATPGTQTISLSGGSLSGTATGSLTVSVTGESFGTFTVSFTSSSDFGDSLVDEDITSVNCEIQQNAGGGNDYVLHCYDHQFVYRPDERIHPNAHTHCPKDGGLLETWLDRVRGTNDNVEEDFFDDEIF